MTPAVLDAAVTPLRVISLGAGVQSSALLLMADAGEFGEAEKPDAAIFADTGWEPRGVYEHLERLEEVIGIPIYRVSAGNLREDALEPGHAFASMPLYIKDSGGSKHQLRRQCTREYKLAPIHRKLRKLLGAGRPKPGSVELWLGISLDEATRMKPSRLKYITHRYPLIECAMTRNACLRYLASQGFEDVPKSACIGCPYMDNARWFDMRENRPEEWADAVDFDKQIRNLRDRHGTAYLHRQAIPLEEIRSEKDMGQLDFGLFDAECEGLCGV